MIRFFSLLFILLLASSCKEVKKVDIEKIKSNESEQKVSVKALNTVKKKEAFLEQIFIDDQKARDPEVALEILKKNNFDKILIRTGNMSIE
ncbi:hypothetical protein [Aquimarina intermedia]|uniref:Uncharacterized protein n=1 Tax=Aquimarina intermedia TaxID=350814 RepID=A0A5S5CCU9_9FLAO|nr:hypothetical protein [Aquimarina intermedia]TYP76979.1 hypothetical protein BD809_101125 [Aquimarina intermedia]